MKKKFSLLLLWCFHTFSLATEESISISNPIYKVTIVNDFDFVQDNDIKEFSQTLGEVTAIVENKTITGLSFGFIKLRYYCNKNPNSSSLLGEQAFGDYSFSFKSSDGNRFLANKSIVEKTIKTFKNNGPCSGSYGGVERSEILEVDFSQFKNTADQHKVTCGNETVQIAWSFFGNFKIFKLYTSNGITIHPVKSLIKEYKDKKKLSQRDRIESQTGRLAPEHDLVVTINDKTISLKNDICGGKLPSPSSLGKFKAIFIHQMNQWGKACDKYPNKCQKIYQKTINPGGVRG